MTTTPAIPLLFSYVAKRPSLVGILDDGQFIDLDGAKIEWHPYQDISHSMDHSIRISDMYPQVYTLTFTKSLKDPWVKWWTENLDVRFRVWHVVFRLESAETPKTKVRYLATGFMSTPPKT